MESDQAPKSRGGGSRSRAPESRDADRLRKKRLLQMIDMAQAYLGCSKAHLAVALKRDPAKVAPDSGNPKLDLVMGISELLDWSVGDVAEALWRDPVEEALDKEPLPEKSFDELNREAIEAHREGDHKRMLRIAGFMWRMAKTPAERGKAANRTMGAYDQAGRYQKALEWARVAASESGVPETSHLNYLAHLGALNYSAWNLHEAAAIASQILRETAEDWGQPLVMMARAMAGYVSGNARRRLMAGLPERASHLGAIALDDLRASAAVHRTLTTLRNDDRFAAIANTCDGAAVEVEFLLGRISAKEGTSLLLNGLDAVVDPATMPRGDWLESWGWWAVFGLNIAVRGLEGDDRQRLAAVFSTKGHEIADRLENWALRERVFSLEHDLKAGPSSAESHGRKLWILDREDVRALLGTMGRFPWFRRIGWEILENAEFV